MTLTKTTHYATAIITILLCAPLLASSETYYDCIKPNGSKVYRAEPCIKGEKEIRNFSVDLSIYDPSKKESVGNTNPRPIDLQPDKNGNYYVYGKINGYPVKFIIDTGATTIAISTQAAKIYGITGCVPGKADTANGITNTCETIASNIIFGDFHLNNVPIAILPNLTTDALLGMNVLSKFKMEQTNSVMRISKQ